MSLKKIISFDLDGTLIESAESIVISANQTASHFNLPGIPRAKVVSSIGRPISELFKSEYGKFADAVELTNYFREHLAKTAHLNSSLMPNVELALGHLVAKGYVLAIASNKPAALSKSILNSFGIINYFQSFQGPGKLRPKPSCELLDAIEDEVSGLVVAHVGDMQDDLEAAASHGARPILYDSENNTSGDLENFDFIGIREVATFKDYSELVEII